MLAIEKKKIVAAGILCCSVYAWIVVMVITVWHEVLLIMKIVINVADWKDGGIRCLLGACQIVGSGDGIMILNHVSSDAVGLLALAGVGVEEVMTYQVEIMTYPRSQIAN